MNSITVLSIHTTSFYNKSNSHAEFKNKNQVYSAFNKSDTASPLAFNGISGAIRDKLQLLTHIPDKLKRTSDITDLKLYEVLIVNGTQIKTDNNSVIAFSLKLKDGSKLSVCEEDNLCLYEFKYQENNYKILTYICGQLGQQRILSGKITDNASQSLAPEAIKKILKTVLKENFPEYI